VAGGFGSIGAVAELDGSTASQVVAVHGVTVGSLEATLDVGGSLLADGAIALGLGGALVALLDTPELGRGALVTALVAAGKPVVEIGGADVIAAGALLLTVALTCAPLLSGPGSSGDAQADAIAASDSSATETPRARRPLPLTPHESCIQEC
jgi:hypothetical protein